MKRAEHKLVITLENVSQADAIALKKMFEYMQHLGRIGSSRWCSFFADGDGSFHPKISFDYPEALPDVLQIDGVVYYNKEKRTLEGSPIHSSDDFAIDSDNIAWIIYHTDEDENYVRKPNPTENKLLAKK